MLALPQCWAWLWLCLLCQASWAKPRAALDKGSAIAIEVDCPAALGTCAWEEVQEVVLLQTEVQVSARQWQHPDVNTSSVLQAPGPRRRGYAAGPVGEKEAAASARAPPGAARAGTTASVRRQVEEASADAVRRGGQRLRQPAAGISLERVPASLGSLHKHGSGVNTSVLPNEDAAAYAQTRSLNSRPNKRGKKGSSTVHVGIPMKLTAWGSVTRQSRRARFVLPMIGLLFPGTVFALFHLSRFPWHPPKDKAEPAAYKAVMRRPSRSSSRLSTQILVEKSNSDLNEGHPSTPRCAPGSATAQLLDERPNDAPGQDAQTLKPTFRRRKTEYGFLDKMFLKHWNRTFGDNLQLTVRGATLALIAGLPLIAPETYFPTLQQFKKTGFWSVGAITLFIFTLWKTVGETVSYAWNGILGTFIASLDIWVMFGLFPGGVSEISPPFVFWVGVANGCVFVTVILWLNVDANTKMFALLDFVWFWMAFLDPGRSDVFSHGFLLTARSVEVSTFLAAISGGGLAVTATLLPWPLWALSKACKGSHEIVAQLGVLWANTVEIYCSAGGRAFENDRLVRELMDLSRDMDSVHEHIRNSWWECFGFGSWQRVRFMLNRLTIVLHDDIDRLYCVLNATPDIQQSNEEQEVVIELEDCIRNLIKQAQWLMQHSANAACCGGFTLEEAQAAQRGIERMNQAVSTLTLDFRELKQEGGGPKVSESLLDDHAFCYNLCALGRLSINFTQDLLKCQADSTMDHILEIKESVGFLGCFDPTILFDAHYLVFVARTALRIFVCFFLGYHGYSNVVKGRNAGIAIPATLLLMRYTGSAIQKNAKRLQAVVFGTVTGVLVHGMVGRCVWWGYAMTGCLYFLWLLLSFYIYFDTVENSYSGLLMAYFGTMNILRGCTNEAFDPSLTHYPITNTVVAIFVVTFFDICFHPGRAAIAAHEAYMQVWQTMKEAVIAVFDPKVKSVEFHRDKIMALAVAAEQLGREAAVEPRWWRTPWPTHVYEKAVQCSFQLCACMSNMEHTVAKAGLDGATKDEVFQALLHISGFQTIGAVLLAKMTQLEKLFKVFVHDTTTPMPELDAPSMLVGYLSDHYEARRKFLAEVSEMEESPVSFGQETRVRTWSFLTRSLEAGSPESKERDVRDMLKLRLSYGFQVNTLEADPASQVSLLLSNIEQMIRTMRLLHHIILRN